MLDMVPILSKNAMPRTYPRHIYCFKPLLTIFTAVGPYVRDYNLNRIV
jgi:hypothetical protein